MSFSVYFAANSLCELNDIYRSQPRQKEKDIFVELTTTTTTKEEEEEEENKKMHVLCHLRIEYK